MRDRAVRLLVLLMAVIGLVAVPGWKVFGDLANGESFPAAFQSQTFFRPDRSNTVPAFLLGDTSRAFPEISAQATYSQTRHVIASGGVCTPLLQSESYGMYGTFGQPAASDVVTSTNFGLCSGFWCGTGMENWTENYIPLTLRSYTPPCDPYEPNDDRYSNPWGPLVSGQSYQAKICTATDEDNYYFDTTTTNPVQLQLQLPASLVNRTSIWLYAQSNLSTPICGTGPVTTASYSTSCPITTPGRYIVRLYTDGACNDASNYTLRATFE